MRRFFTAFLFFVIGAALLQAQEPAKQDKGLTLTTVTGKRLHIKGTENGLDIREYRGKILFLEFWGTHCPPCLMSIPHYIDLSKKYKGKLAVLAIEVQDTPADLLKSFVTKHKINYDVVDYRTGMPLVNYISRRAQWRGSIPFLLIFNSKGEYVTSQVGLLPEETLEGVIKTLEKMKTEKGNEQNNTTPAKPVAK
ncbi:TlpA family protein disulfide reductase [Nitratifractor salsuginis]|uniref:Redoxin domain protein n=1 Tax=Nitratifractor salsuginis (strain DSM 16511 / JCM 12458 / E9I37-1) TaxID=749222 RepID=E6WZZ4_NITSE|nr:TlpA disulfide reductase family protein [Nitratifractor salsuginis]ADV45652.1 Redoxin domain protein [Nitratifractor salsuginis DSM 16511]